MFTVFAAPGANGITFRGQPVVVGGSAAGPIFTFVIVRLPPWRFTVNVSSPPGRE
jgi:hypothetical protein